jgi:hypothetical protein
MRLACASSIALSLWLAASGAAADPADQQFFTDFQGMDAEDPSDFGLGPAHFTGGDAFDVGVPELANGDDRAWILGPGKMARIDFDVPVGVVELRAVGLDGATVRAVGITTVDVTGTDIADPGQGLIFSGEIDAIEFTNTSELTDTGDWDLYGASIDDIGFTLFDVTARCAGEQLQAAASFCKAELSCWSKYVKKPSKDPGQSKRQACSDKAHDRLEKKHAKAIARAVDDGGECALVDDVDTFIDASFLTPMAALRDDHVLAGWDPDTAGKQENKTRSKLLKAAASLCGSAFKTESRNAMGDDDAGAAEKRQKARDKFESKAGKTIAKGMKKGFDDPGFDVPSMGDDVEALVDDFAILCEGTEEPI